MSLDMLSGLAEGLGSSIESLVLASNPPLPNLIHQCLLVRFKKKKIDVLNFVSR